MEREVVRRRRQRLIGPPELGPRGVDAIAVVRHVEADRARAARDVERLLRVHRLGDDGVVVVDHVVHAAVAHLHRRRREHRRVAAAVHRGRLEVVGDARRVHLAVAGHPPERRVEVARARGGVALRGVEGLAERQRRRRVGLAEQAAGPVAGRARASWRARCSVAARIRTWPAAGTAVPATAATEDFRFIALSRSCRPPDGVRREGARLSRPPGTDPSIGRGRRRPDPCSAPTCYSFVATTSSVRHSGRRPRHGAEAGRPPCAHASGDAERPAGRPAAIVLGSVVMSSGRAASPVPVSTRAEDADGNERVIAGASCRRAVPPHRHAPAAWAPTPGSTPRSCARSTARPTSSTRPARRAAPAVRRRPTSSCARIPDLQLTTVDLGPELSAQPSPWAKLRGARRHAARDRQPAAAGGVHPPEQDRR